MPKRFRLLVLLLVTAVFAAVLEFGAPAVTAQDPPDLDEHCLTCHIDEARLQELAVEEEDSGEELSQGPG